MLYKLSVATVVAKVEVVVVVVAVEALAVVVVATVVATTINVVAKKDHAMYHRVTRSRTIRRVQLKQSNNAFVIPHVLAARFTPETRQDDKYGDHGGADERAL